ncbi:hypothetical protein [Streptomyces sp. NPDC001978]|uniref:hypothetical protein n=1 Tax=Streptomyces sp. NPDC001978 TaxID=3364627 RepID=UPI0036CA8496
MTDLGNTPGSLRDLLAEIEAHQGCAVESPESGSVAVDARHRVPTDLRELHRLCAGVLFHVDSDYPWWLTGPSGVVPAGPLLLTPEVAEQVAAEDPEDLTNSCYVIAQESPGATSSQLAVIDLHPQRVGRCYLTAWDSFGLVGEMPIVALSMAELLRWLLGLGVR